MEIKKIFNMNLETKNFQLQRMVGVFRLKETKLLLGKLFIYSADTAFKHFNCWTLLCSYASE